MMRIGLLAVITCMVVLPLLIGGCSSSVGGSSFSILAPSHTVAPGGTVTFKATKASTWSVQEPDGGTITSNGVYTAPPVTGTYHIIATSTANSSDRTTFTVTVTTTPPAGAFAVGAMADAAYDNQPYGANLLRWPSMNSRVVAYIIYRDGNPNAPLAVVDGHTTSYADSAIPLTSPAVMQSTVVTITLDPNSGAVTQFSFASTLDDSLDQLTNGQMTVSDTNFTVTARRVPLNAGENSGYQVRALYIEYKPNDLNDPSLSHPDSYHLVLGAKSAVSAHVTLTAPPALSTPADQVAPVDGRFNCALVPRATSYLLQISSSAVFPQQQTYSMLATDITGSTAQAPLALADIVQRFPSFSGQMLFWRMGARVDGETLPFSQAYPNMGGWVFSLPRTFRMPTFPPAP